MQLYNTQILNQLVCSQMQVNEQINTDVIEVTAVLNAMMEMGLLIKLENIYNKAEVNYYITNPSITNQLLKSVVNALDSINLPKKSNRTIKRINGKVYESIIAVHTLKAASKTGNNVYFYHDNANEEVDLIVERETGTVFDDLYLYYEIKMTSNSDAAVMNTKWLNSFNVENNIGGTIVGRGIIYGGKTKQFQGFEDSGMYPPSGKTLQQIELLNMNTQLINAEEFLLDTQKQLAVLENYVNNYYNR